MKSSVSRVRTHFRTKKKAEICQCCETFWRGVCSGFKWNEPSCEEFAPGSISVVHNHDQQFTSLNTLKILLGEDLVL